MLGTEAGPVVELPGGVLSDNGLERRVVFHTFTGSMELQLLSYAAGDINPATVTDILFSAIASLGEQPLRYEDVESMSVGDRQFLVLSLAILLGDDQVWLRPECNSCHLPFDVGFVRSQLPIQLAGDGYPNVSVQIHNDIVTLRIPTGADQARLAGLTAQEAVAVLLQQCVLAVNDQTVSPEWIAGLNAADIATIEAALETIAPEVAMNIATQCPECGAEQLLGLEPYAMSALDDADLFEDIHSLAFHYHWSEDSILSLPRERRRLYLSLVERDKGMHS